MTVDAVFVLYGGAADLPDAVAAVRAQPRITRIVAVDNASPDGAGAVARDLGIDVIDMGGNAGYAAAMNRAFAATDGEYLLTVNADARLRAGYVDRLVVAIEQQPRAAGATGLLVLADGTIDSTGIEVSTAYWAADRDRGAPPDAAAAVAPFGVSGAAALFRRAALADLGPAPWWDWLFAYWDDVELAWRLRRRGWTFAFVPDAVADHRRGADTADPTRIEALSFRNRLATVARHAGVRGLVRPGSLAVTATVGARLAVRHPRALRDAHPLAAARAGLAARRDHDPNLGPITNGSVLTPHRWRPWLRRQLTGRASRPV